jgi:hypothetical protein
MFPPIMVGGMYFLPEDKFDGIEVHVIEFPRGILAGQKVSIIGRTSILEKDPIQPEPCADERRTTEDDDSTQFNKEHEERSLENHSTAVSFRQS